MPLLTSEPDLWPAGLFDLCVEEAPWQIAHVRSRCEKALARHLRQHRVPFYLPLEDRVLLHSGRERVSRVPLFAGYVFYRGLRPARLTALQSQRVVRSIPVEDQELLQVELLRLQSLQERGFLLVPHPYLGPGDSVEIVQGAFRGYKGVVIRERDRERLVVGITLLRQAISVEMGRQGLRPLEIGRGSTKGRKQSPRAA